MIGSIVLGLSLVGCADDDGSGAGGTGGSSTGPVSTPGSTTHDDGTTSGADSTTSGGENESSSSTGEPVPDPLVWSDQCVFGKSDFTALHPQLECTAIEVPLDWDDPDGEQITVAAFVVRSTAARRLGTLWQLDGGPGSSGIAFFLNHDRVETITDAGWDFLVPAHRGTLSPQLRCSGPPLASACRTELEQEWGGGLRHFNTVNAAHDLAEFLARAAVDDDGAAIVYGVSYGTYLAQFLLGLHPHAADAVVLDSVLPAEPSVMQQESVIDSRAVALLQECVDDPVCGARVPFESGEAFGQAVIDAFNNSDCGAIDNGTWMESELHDTFGQLLNRQSQRNYIPLLAALAQRCTPEDSTLVSDAILGLNTAFQLHSDSVDPLAEERARASRYGGVSNELFFRQELFAVVVATSLVPDGADVELGAEVLASSGLASTVDEAQSVFGTLPNAPFETEFVPEIPVLILNARYDLQTPLPWAEGVADQYGSSVVVIEDAQHGVAIPGTGGRDLDGTPCVHPLVMGFAAAPDDPIDDACIATLPAIDVNLVRPDLGGPSQMAFGTSDPWSLFDAK